MTSLLLEVLSSQSVRRSKGLESDEADDQVPKKKERKDEP